jgi:MFS family permease
MISEFVTLLRRNANYRNTWMGQVVSEIGDHFNNIAVFSLAMQATGSGLVISGIMISRAVPVILAGPVAGVLLDRMDRKRVMIASDLIRFVVAIGFIITIHYPFPWLMYLLSAMLMFASPFFTSGRTAILPTIASREELHTANSLTQTTQWTTLTIGTMAAGLAAGYLGYHWAFVINSISFLFSAWAISRLRLPSGSFTAQRQALTENRVIRPWHEYVEGLRYMKSSPLIMGIALVHVGWATGGGAAQILFTLFGEQVFNRGPAGIGIIWSFAGIGLLAGGALGHSLGKRLTFSAYKLTISICYVVHGGAYVFFSQMESFAWALFFIALSRAGVAVSSVLNFFHLLRNVPDEFRGRAFSTMETVTWSTMMLSMGLAGVASEHYSPRAIGFVSGIASSMTAVFWGWANWSGRLPEPRPLGSSPEDIEVREPTV